MSLTVAVIGHIDRADEAAHLVAQLAPAALFLDDGSLGEWANHERALRWGSTTDTTHLLVIQDDAIPIDGFLELADKAATEQPQAIIGLYVGKQRPREVHVTRAVAQAERDGASWLASDSLWWGVATIFRTGILSQMLDECATSRRPYDRRVGDWAKRNAIPVLYTWPSLVDHADQPSLIQGRPQRAPGRVAHKVGIPSYNDIAVRIQ